MHNLFFIFGLGVTPTDGVTRGGPLSPPPPLDATGHTLVLLFYFNLCLLFYFNMCLYSIFWIIVSYTVYWCVLSPMFGNKRKYNTIEITYRLWSAKESARRP